MQTSSRLCTTSWWRNNYRNRTDGIAKLHRMKVKGPLNYGPAASARLLRALMPNLKVSSDRDELISPLQLAVGLIPETYARELMSIHALNDKTATKAIDFGIKARRPNGARRDNWTYLCRERQLYQDERTSAYISKGIRRNNQWPEFRTVCMFSAHAHIYT